LVHQQLTQSESPPLPGKNNEGNKETEFRLNLNLYKKKQKNREALQEQ